MDGFCRPSNTGPGRWVWLLVLWLAGTSLAAEPVAPLFFPDEPVFSPVLAGLPLARAWVGGRHVLNQDDSPWYGHDLESGVDLVLVSGEFWALRFGVTEDFQFRVNPAGDWLLWARSLLSDLWLMSDWRLGCLLPGQPLVLSLGLRHDCKHDIETNLGRTAVHDTLGLYLYQSLGQLELDRDLSAGLAAQLAGEAFLGQVFQSLSPEPYELKLSGSLQLVPLAWTIPGGAGTLRLFAEARLALLLAGSGTAVQLAPGWSADGRLAWGAEFLAGQGRIRLWHEADWCNDWWIDNQPRPAFLSSVGLAFIF